MFEKEAEEIANKSLCSKMMCYNHCNFNSPKHHRCGDWHRCYEIAKDGAEFGYNKANEWHYVKDGDLPKAYQECYFIYSNTYGEDNKVIFSEGNINVLTGLYAFYLDEETGEETTDPCFYDDINDDEISPSEVYAWKEIVLPKEIDNGKERT